MSEPPRPLSMTNAAAQKRRRRAGKSEVPALMAILGRKGLVGRGLDTPGWSLCPGVMAPLGSHCVTEVGLWQALFLGGL